MCFLRLKTTIVKIGAQTENYRVFLSARYYDADNLSTLNTYGAEIQYMFNFSKPVTAPVKSLASNIFLWIIRMVKQKK